MHFFRFYSGCFEAEAAFPYRQIKIVCRVFADQLIRCFPYTTMEKKRMSAPLASPPIRRSRFIVVVIALVGFIYFFGSPFRLPEALKDVPGLSRANIVQFVKPKSKTSAKVDEIFGLLHLVTGDSEHEHILGHTESFDPTKPIDMSLYAAGKDDVDWNKRAQEINEQYPLVVFSTVSIFFGANRDLHP
jgi:hypothetical protein